ncbi:hypothetical protein [Paenibacillus odorifer]|uniref:hypothetical protein n=1 Tax=Paenibacillus odorifer TaxID=189426 RepID=UPI0015C378F5|nr:hypothetical protein [Paenibacillus odorifer]
MAYYALHELHIMPHELMAMSKPDRAAIYAMILVRIDKEKKDAAKSKVRKK